jgi:hypothetical protein
VTVKHEVAGGVNALSRILPYMQKARADANKFDFHSLTPLMLGVVQGATYGNIQKLVQ